MSFNYNWIVHNFAQGNFPGTRELAFQDFDVVVLCAEEHQPSWRSGGGKFVFRLPLDDDPYRPLPPDVQKVIIDTAHAVATYHASGHPVVSTCHMGHNRSGLVTCLVLMECYGMSADDAIRLVRDKRGDDCIGNPMFEQFLRNHG